MVHTFEPHELPRKPWYDPHRSREQYYDPSIAIDVFMNPERLSDKPVISASLLSKEKHTVFEAVGFILRGPLPNLIAANHIDTGYDFFRGTVDPENTVTELQAQFGLPAPELILQKTTNVFNEVFIRGHSSSGKTQIAAIYLEENPGGNTILEYGDPWERERILQLSRILNIPIVRESTWQK